MQVNLQEQLFKTKLLTLLSLQIMKRILSAVLISLALTACHAPKTVTYIPDAETLTAKQLATVNPLTEPVFMPGDLVYIEITASSMR